MRPSQNLLALLVACASSLLALLLAVEFGLPSAESWRVSLGNDEFRLTNTQPLLLLCALPLLGLGAFFSLTALAPAQRLLSLVVRALFLLTLTLALAKPTVTRDSTRVCPTVLLDVSESVGDAALSQALGRIAALRRRHPELRAIAFGAEARALELPAPGSRAALTVQNVRNWVTGSGTDVEGAVELARAFTDPGCLPRYLVLSDGIETRGDALSAIADARALGVRVSTAPLSDKPPSDVATLSVGLPPAVTLGEPFEVRVELRATAPTVGTLELLQGQTENGLGGRRVIAFGPGHHIETFKSVVRVPGPLTYRATFRAERPDHFPGNDAYSARIDVPGPPRVLLIDRHPEQLAQVTRALAAQQFDVDVRPPAALPRTQAELDAFAFVLLSDLPRAVVSRTAEQELVGYVQRGGGLLYSGGEAAFGPGGWQGSDLEKILPVRMDAEKDRETPGVAMALVIDRSGSMTGLPLAMAKEACAATLTALSPNDLLEVIAFDSQPTRVVHLQPARFRAAIQSALVTIQPGGGTEIFPSLDMAYQDLAGTEARKKHIVLLTDGNAPSEGIYDLAVAAFAEGITLTTVGLGQQTNRELLTMIAEAGGGRYHAAEDPTSLPRIFTREAELLSREVAPLDYVPVVLARRVDFMAGLHEDALPYLRGLTRTQLAPDPSELVLRSDVGDPVLARRRSGRGWTLAWTGDLKPRLGVEWLRWPQFPRFLAQLVRAHQKRDDEHVVPLEVELEDRQAVVTFDARTADGRFDSSWVSSLSARADGDGVPSLEAPFQLEAPGRYVARIALPSFGAYSLLSTHQRPSASGELLPAGVGRATVSLPYPEEYRELEARPRALRSWAEAGGGIFAPKDEELFQKGPDRLRADEPAQAPLLYLGLVLLLLDVVLRRVRLFDRAFQASRNRAT